MPCYYVDLHIHIGRTPGGQAVKITASDDLTLTNILEEASVRKGLDMVGVIDCHSPGVLTELRQLIRDGLAYDLPGGGVRYGQTTLIPGTEMEIYDVHSRGPVHVLCFLPHVEAMETFSQWMSRHQKNIHLSSQRTYASAIEVQYKVRELEGMFVPAHVFTPYKSVYGKGVYASITELFDPDLVDALELGLSSDSAMADQLPELRYFPFLTNSDAHSLPKIGREYQLIGMDSPDFAHLKRAVRRRDGQPGAGHVVQYEQTSSARVQGIICNYGLHPSLGKYHREVTDRMAALEKRQRESEGADRFSGNKHEYGLQRPPYIHQVPLEFIPGIGPKTMRRLLDAFGTEMMVMHKVSAEQLERWLPADVVRCIMDNRSGKTDFIKGGAGKFGKLAPS